jgi:N utilization substance protein A
MKALDADETLAQLLASEGFETVEEIAFVESDDLAVIEGFDDEIAEELQTRAREYLDRLSEELNQKRKSLGVDDAVLELDGMTLPMAVTFGENDIKTIEDVAGLVPDDLTGWREPGADGKPAFQPGLLAKGEMSADDAELFVMRARNKVGWIDDEALAEIESKHVTEEAEDDDGLSLTEEERALMALGDLGGDVSFDEASSADEADLPADTVDEEGADDDAKPQ